MVNVQKCGDLQKNKMPNSSKDKFITYFFKVGLITDLDWFSTEYTVNF